MDQHEMCPWDTHPATVEAMLIACNAQGKWEHEHQRSAPLDWHICPTRQMFGGLCARLLQLEAEVRNERR